jgi:paraquat-inducible protein A
MYTEESHNLMACHECDALIRKHALPAPATAHCPCCHATLYRNGPSTLGPVCAVTLAALITFLIGQAFPIVELETNGITTSTTLIGAIVALWGEQMQLVAVVVFCSTILFPVTELLALLYVTVPVRAGCVPSGFNQVLRFILAVRPWGMIEVFMLGVVVTLVKMTSVARVIPETALFAFGALTIMFTAVVLFDPKVLWDIAGCLPAPRRYRRSTPGYHDSGQASSSGHAQPARAVQNNTRTAVSASGATGSHCTTAWHAGLIACHACGQIERCAFTVKTQHCSRCGALLHRRNPDSLARTWALLVTAAGLYIPANILPVMHTSTLLGSQDDTILSGAALFWNAGDYPLAAIIFVASIMIPVLKLVSLAVLAYTTQTGSTWRLHERMTLYRIIEHVGRWSMLDIFVITLTIALVHFGSLAVITAGPGALAFASVVVLTMTATMQFDPRLMWDHFRTSGQTHV